MSTKGGNNSTPMSKTELRSNKSAAASKKTKSANQGISKKNRKNSTTTGNSKDKGTKSTKETGGSSEAEGGQGKTSQPTGSGPDPSFGTDQQSSEEEAETLTEGDTLYGMADMKMGGQLEPGALASTPPKLPVRSGGTPGRGPSPKPAAPTPIQPAATPAPTNQSQSTPAAPPEIANKPLDETQTSSTAKP